MALFHMSRNRELVSLSPTSFAIEGILERADLQAALRDNIAVLGDDLLVVSEEFGEFQDVRRRIDLLCVNRDGQLVVIELKRTEDGGHMELQALRYAAMVSTMTFDQLVDAYARHLMRVEPASEGEARTRLATFLDDVGGEDTVLDRRVRILLVAAGFDPQITTTVLWLNDLYGLDIACVRLVPYRVDEKLILDVQQVIPLPEAEELMVRLRHRETAARAAASSDGGADWTPYIIVTPAGRTEPLRKRRAILAMAQALHEAGVSCAGLAEAVPGPRFLSVEGILEGEDLVEAFVDAHPAARNHLRRWFFEVPFHSADDQKTWVLSKMWGTNTVATLNAFAALAPEGGFGFEPATK